MSTLIPFAMEFSVRTADPLSPGISRIASKASLDENSTLVPLTAHSKAFEFPVAHTQVIVISPGHRNCLSQTTDVAAVKKKNQQELVSIIKITIDPWCLRRLYNQPKLIISHSIAEVILGAEYLYTTLL